LTSSVLRQAYRAGSVWTTPWKTLQANVSHEFLGDGSAEAMAGSGLVRSAEADLRPFQELRAGNVTTSVDRAAVAIVNGLVRRRSRVYVPRALVVANWAKAVLNSPFAWPWMRRFAAQVAPALEREVEALGRHDQLVLGIAAAKAV
jgi:hypothetical protein